MRVETAVIKKYIQIFEETTELGFPPPLPPSEPAFQSKKVIENMLCVF
jgi:hypothetical protein